MLHNQTGDGNRNNGNLKAIIDRGHDRDGRTKLRDVDSYLDECRTLLAHGRKPFYPHWHEQHVAAFWAGLIDFKPAVGEFRWQDFREPEPLSQHELDRFLVTLSGSHKNRLALRRAMREPSR